MSRFTWPVREIVRVIDGDTIECVIDRGFGDRKLIEELPMVDAPPGPHLYEIKTPLPATGTEDETCED